jgi:hypothetical protein
MPHQVLLSHALLDAARMLDQMDVAKKLNPGHDSLYRGRSEEALAIVAPYLFSYQEGTEFAGWLASKGWGDSWGVFLYSEASMAELHRHFCKFLLVKTEEGQELYFRFYDPRVLRIFLPTCDEEQLREFFGPVRYFMMEDEDPSQAIVFYRSEGKLGSYTLPVSNSETTKAENKLVES